jgi:hypothetical protein
MIGILFIFVKNIILDFVKIFTFSIFRKDCKCPVPRKKNKIKWMYKNTVRETIHIKLGCI